MYEKKKILIYSIIGILILGAIIFALCSHFVTKKEQTEFNGFTFKEVAELNYGEFNLSDFIEDIHCEDECFYQNEKIEYTISQIDDLGKQEILVSVNYQSKTYEQVYNIEVVDNSSPIITLSKEEIQIEKDSEFDPLEYITQVSDNYDELTIEEVQIESKVDTTKAGSYEVIYTLSDSSENIGTSTLTVEVVEEIEEDNETNKTDNTDNKTNNSSNNNTNNNSNNTTTNNNTNNTSSSFKTAVNGVSLSPLTTGYSELDNKINSILSSTINSSKTNYEKLQAIYNYVKNKLSYNQVPTSLNAVSDLQELYSYYQFDALQIVRAMNSLNTNYGVCDNYAALFIILARRIGFDAYVVGGTSPDGSGGRTGHAWVMIKVGSTYYIFDPQIEDRVGTSYNYFGKTDKELTIYEYNLSSSVSSFKFFKENPNQPHHFTANFTSSLDNESMTLESDGTYYHYSSLWLDKGESANITLSASRTQNYKLEILKNDEVISSESYDGSSKTVTFDFSDVGDVKYDVRIYLTYSRYVQYGIVATVSDTP